jgi:hypothetical protein
MFVKSFMTLAPGLPLFSVQPRLPGQHAVPFFGNVFVGQMFEFVE